MGTNKVNIARGIKLLDRTEPSEWPFCVNLKSLDLSCGYNCVLGQLYGRFLGGKYALALTEEEAISLGFLAAERENIEETPAMQERAIKVQYAALTAAWREAILELRKGWRQA